jgi:hypothetical protein
MNLKKHPEVDAFFMVYSQKQMKTKNIKKIRGF